MVVYPIIYLSNTIGSCVGSNILQLLGLKLTIVFGSLCISLGQLLNLLPLPPMISLILYGAVTGFGGGILIIISVAPAWSYFDKARGRVTGIILLGYNAGTAMFGLAFSKLINSNSSKAIWNNKAG